MYAAGTATGESCLDPDFVNEPATFASEATLDGYTFTLASNSPARGAGVSVSGLARDYLGEARTSPTSLGALEYGTSVNLNNLTSWVTAATSPVSTPPNSPSSPVTTPPVTPPAKAPYATSLALSVGGTETSPTLKATLVSANGAGKSMKGGVVLYNQANTPLAKGLVSATGTVSWPISAALEAQTIYAVYLGNPTFTTSTSTVVNLTQAVAALQ